MRILVTGGAGYIGTHVIIELVTAGHEPIVVDNFSNSSREMLTRVEKIIDKPIVCYEGDVADKTLLNKVFNERHIDAVIHFAAFKAVGESVAYPLMYYRNNVSNFVGLLEVATTHNVRRVVFSSTAAVYGTAQETAVSEDVPCAPESPYGWSKYMDETVLRDTCTAIPEMQGTVLRYFNVVGAHPSGEIGELPRGVPQNLLPVIIQAITNDVPLTVYGTDYATPDGTCQRDYIHVVDLARAHVGALQRRGTPVGPDYRVYNIGTGRPTSVLELIHSFEKINNVRVPHILGERRPGDPVVSYASAKRANDELVWYAKKTIEDACADSWRWQLHYKIKPLS